MFRSDVAEPVSPLPWRNQLPESGHITLMERKHIVVDDDGDDLASDSAIVFGGWRRRAREKQLRLGRRRRRQSRWHCWPFASPLCSLVLRLPFLGPPPTTTILTRRDLGPPQCSRQSERARPRAERFSEVEHRVTQQDLTLHVIIFRNITSGAGSHLPSQPPYFSRV